ncbi:hypothetical protein [Streptomyces sp. NPDC006645]|uniref:hypothetical protein n=1 Tax=unclassified Streptomyces TaxID=2593676 RepID=UPI0033AB5C9B
MRAAPTTHIGTSQGTVNTGPGDQHIHNYLQDMGPLSKDPKGRTPRALAEEELNWLRDHFENPEGFIEAFEKLREQNTVLLDGEHGDGRNAAARMLLVRIEHGGKSLHEVLLREEEGSSRQLDPESIGDEDRLLLDLSRSSDDVWQKVEPELSEFRESVRLRRAKLVVILPRGVARRLSPELTRLRFVITRPPGMELDIVKRHLRVAGIDPTLTDTAPTALEKFLVQRRPLAEVATFAQYVCQAHRDGDDFPGACDTALDALQGQPAGAADLLAKVRNQSARALLLAAAMLQGARADAVHRAAALLLEAADPTASKRPALQHPLLSKRLQPLRVQIDASGRVHFAELGLDVAVRACVWNDFPQLRETLRDWVGDALALPELGDTDREALVTRFAEQTLACRRPQDLLILVERWSRTDKNGTQLHGAATALIRGLHDREFGREFRSSVYNWSIDDRLPPGRRKVLVDVCRDDMAVSHPNAALVRLHQLARREKHSIMARPALLHLTADDHRLRRRLLSRLGSYLGPVAYEGAVRKHAREDVSFFLEHSAPGPLTDAGTRGHPLISESGVRNDLTTGWAAVFSIAPAEEWTTSVHGWFSTACAEPASFDVLIDTLIAACDRRGDRLASLYNAALAWTAPASVPHAEAADLAGRVLRKMPAATHHQPPTARETR